MKIWMRFVVAFALVWALILPFSPVVEAQLFDTTPGSSTTTPGTSGTGAVSGASSVPASGRNTLLPFDPTRYPGVQITTIRGVGAAGVVATVRGLFGTMKQVLAPILVILMIYFAVQMVTAQGEEEKFSSVTRHFSYLLAGVGIIVLADFLSQTFTLYGDTQESFVNDQGQIVATVDRLRTQIDILVRFVRYVIGGIALFYVIKSGSQILFSPEEEMVDQQKQVFMYGFVGLLLIMISEALVRSVFDIDSQVGLPFGELFVESSLNVEGGLGLIGNVTNLFLAGMSSLFLFTLVVGGAMYAFSAGNEERGERGTKIIIGSLLGLVIAFSSYTIVAEFSSGGRQLRVVPTDIEGNLDLPRSPTTP